MREDAVRGSGIWEDVCNYACCPSSVKSGETVHAARQPPLGPLTGSGSAVLCRSGQGGEEGTPLLTSGSAVAQLSPLPQWWLRTQVLLFGVLLNQGSTRQSWSNIQFRSLLHPGVLGAAVASIQAKPAHSLPDFTKFIFARNALDSSYSIFARVLYINSVGMHAQSKHQGAQGKYGSFLTYGSPRP